MALRRRGLHLFFGALAAVTLLMGRPAAAADDADTLSLKLEWIPWGYHLHIMLAAEKGWFKQSGLDVTIIDGNGSATTVQLVGVGQFDVGQASLANMAFARGKGMPVISIGGFFRKGDLGLFVPKDSTISSPADLKGRTAVYTAGSLEGPFIDAFLAKGGLKREDVQLLNVDAAAKTSVYLTKQAEAMFSSAPFALPLVEAQRSSRAVMFADFGLNLPSSGLFTTEQMLKKKGPALRKLASILAGSLAYVMNGHVDEAVAATLHQRPEARLDPAVLKGQFELGVTLIATPATANLPIGPQAASDWADAIAAMEKADAIPPGSKPSDYFTNDYLDLDLAKKIAGS
jgi:NitT/TauT family transport system substrate-binding protein